jgi:hypothetical protein
MRSGTNEENQKMTNEENQKVKHDHRVMISDKYWLAAQRRWKLKNPGLRIREFLHEELMIWDHEEKMKYMDEEYERRERSSENNNTRKGQTMAAIVPSWCDYHECSKIVHEGDKIIYRKDEAGERIIIHAYHEDTVTRDDNLGTKSSNRGDQP